MPQTQQTARPQPRTNSLVHIAIAEGVEIVGRSCCSPRAAAAMICMSGEPDTFNERRLAACIAREVGA